MFSYFFSFFIIINATLLYAEDAAISPFIHQYEVNYIYEGDMNGHHKGDFVAVLDDGSCWRVHSQDSEKFAKWKIGERIHLETQARWYFFGSYLSLFNHENKTSIQVTLLKTNLYVFFTDKPQPSKSTRDQFGTFYHDYRQNIEDSKLRPWEIKDPNLKNPFKNYSPIYIGYNLKKSNGKFSETYLKDEDKYVAYFIVNGLENESNWWWARPGNTSYYFLGY